MDIIIKLFKRKKYLFTIQALTISRKIKSNATFSIISQIFGTSEVKLK